MAIEKPIMKNKQGRVELKDVVVVLLIFSGIIALSSIFVQEMGDSYSNTNMTTSYNQDTIGTKNLTSTSEKFADIGERMRDGGIDAFVAGVQGVLQMFVEVLKAPATFVSMMTSILADAGVVEGPIITIINYILSGILYAIIIFAIGAAVMQRSTGI